MEVCWHGHIEVVELLAKRGADINVRESDGWSVFTLACANGHTKVAGSLIERGTEVNVRDVGVALYEACQFGYVKVVELLIERGGDVNATNEKGRTALMAASGDGHAKVVELLLEHGVDVNATYEHDGRVTALMEACYNGHVKVVELLLEHIVDVNVRDVGGWTALVDACWNGHVNVAELLLESGGDVNVRDKDGRTPLITTCTGAFEIDRYGYKRAAVLELLLQHGADIDTQCEQLGRSAVMQAVRNDHDKCLQKLLLSDPNLDLTDKQGNTVFSFAMRRKVNSVCLRLLLADGNLLTEGNLRPVHKNYIGVCNVLNNLMVTIEAGVFEWEWCPLRHFKPMSLAALRSGYCPGKIKYNPTMNVSPFIVSFLENDTELIDTFIIHIYYFHEDYRTLSSDHDIRARIENKGLLDDITRQPMSLQTRCLQTVSKSIAVSGSPRLRSQRVNLLPIPDRLKRRLKFVLD